MQALLFLAFAATGVALWFMRDEYKPGESPFERLPQGVSPSPAGDTDVNASSGRKYVVSHWVPDAAGKQFHVAELKGKPAWVAYWADRATNKRTHYASMGTADDVRAMRGDFSV